MSSFVAGSVSVLVKPILTNMHKDIKQQLNSSGFEAVGRDIGEDIANPIKKEVSEAGKEATKNLDKELGKAGKKTKLSLTKPFSAEGTKAGKAFAESVNKTIKTGIKVGAIAAVAGGALFLKDAITEASNLEQSIGGLEAVFKENAGQMKQYSEEAAQTMGLSKNEFNELAAILGTQLKAGGLDGSELTSEVQNLTLLGADLSSLFGGTAPEAVNALSAALRGEMEPARRYGITLDQAAIKNKALEMGLISAGEEMDQNAKTQATLALITEQTADASGNFARENDTLAGKTARASAQFDNMKATVGGALLPALTGIMEVVNTSVLPAIGGLAEGVKTVVGYISDNLPWIGTLAATITAIGVATYLSAGGASALALGVKGVFTAISAGVKAIPVIGWIIAAIGLLAAGLTYFFTKTETGKQMWEKIWPAIKNAAAVVVDWFNDKALPVLAGVWDKIVQGATWLWEKMKLVWAGVKLGINLFINWARQELVPRAMAIWEAVGKSASNLWNNHLKPAFEKVKNGVMPIVDWVREKLGGLFGGGAGEGATSGIAGALKTITGVATNVFEVLKAVFGGITWVLENILLPVFRFVFGAIGWIVTIAVGVIEAVIKSLIWVWQNVLAPTAKWLWQNVIVPVWNGIQKAIEVVVDVVKAIIDGLVWFWQNVLAPAAEWLWGVIQTVWDGILLAVAVVVTAVNLYIDLLVWYFKNIIAPVAMWLYENVFLPAWNGIKAAIGAVVNWFKDVAWPMLKTAWDAVAAAANWLWTNVFVPVWNGIKAAIKAVVDWFQLTAWPIISSVIDWIKNKFELFKQGLEIIWTYIKNTVINPVIAWFRDTAWPLISGVIDKIKTAFDVMRGALKTAWDAVKNNIVKPVVDWFDTKVKPKIQGVADAITSAFETMKDNVGTAWEKIKDLVSEPISFVVNDVINKGVVKTFNDVAKALGIDTRLPNVTWNAGSGSGGGGGKRSTPRMAYRSGGVLPGYTPGKDVHEFFSPVLGRLSLSGGEAIMRPEWTKAVGPGFVNMMNRLAASRGVQGVREAMSGGISHAYKNGGVIDWFKNIGGDTWDFIKNAASKAHDFLADPLGMFGKVVDGMFEGFTGSGAMFDAARAVPKKIVQGIKTMFDNSEQAAGGAGGPIGPMPPGASRSLSYARQVASSYGLTMTSFRRSGARTAGSGSVSLHALGRAMDFSNSSGPTRQMMDFFNAMHPLKPTELLYSPAGGRQWRRSGRMSDTSGATKRGHYNHVHIGFKSGGVLPELHDRGGMLQPGLNLISNKTRKPEAILTDRQWETAYSAMSSATSSRNITINQNIRDIDVTANRVADEVTWGLRKAEIRSRM